MNQFQQARNQVLNQIKNACDCARRDPAMVRLLAVSKTHPSQSLREMYQLGQQCFG